MSTTEIRRQDHELRSAINRIQTNFSHVRNSNQLYALILKELTQLCCADFSFVVEKGFNYGQINSHEVFAFSPNEGEVFKKNVRLADELWFMSRLFHLGRAEVFEASHLSDIPYSRLHWPIAQSLLCLPMIDEGSVVAIVCLANCTPRLPASEVKRFWPLLTTVTCARRNLLRRGTIDNYESFARDLINDPLETLALIEKACPIGIIEVNQLHKIVKINPAAEQMFALVQSKALNMDIAELLPERYPNEHHTHTFARRTQAKNNKIRFLAIRSDRRTFPIDASVIAYQVQNECFFLMMIQDISAIETALENNASQQQRFKAVTDLTPVGIMQLDKDWCCNYANDQWCETSDTALEGLLDKGWINAFHPEDAEQTLRDLHGSIKRGEQFERRFRLRTRLGKIVWIDFYARPIFDEKNNLSEILATINDVTYRHTTEQKLRTMAEKDVLTGLVNRALLLDRLSCAMSRIDRHGPLALLSLDLDGFKTVNDSLGHDAGDILLREVAKRLSQCVRAEDTVARMGGDEFMILIEAAMDSAVAARVSETVLKRLELPFMILGHEIYISASIGISFCLTTDQSETHVMKQADIALYRAKDQGKNNYQYYSPELEHASKERLATSTRLHQALSREEFELYFQLQADVQTGEPIGTEALLRWHHPERGTLSPYSFLAVLEESGLILEVGDWIIEQSCRQFRKWLDLGVMDLSKHISINLSPKQLKTRRCVQTLTKALDRYRLPAQVIYLEITESVLLDASDETVSILNELKQLGVGIALDDFGTGYSSLTYLRRFPIDFIKIDRSFVENIDHDKDDCTITQAVITLAQSLGLKAIAEGVADPQQLTVLERFGCHFYQGHLLNEACDATGVERLIFDNTQAATAAET